MSLPKLSAAEWRAWWYLALAIGFVLLAIANWIKGDKPVLIALRFVLAAGFGVLSWFEFAAKSRRGP